MSYPSENLRDYDSSYDNRRSLIDDLRQIFEECTFPDWCGSPAQPVSERTYKNTVSFVEALPVDLESPSPGAEPDGHLTLEWHHSPRRVISISIDENGMLHYAALIDRSSHHGSEPLDNGISDILLSLIRKVVSPQL